jgi:hypothetical protein
VLSCIVGASSSPVDASCLDDCRVAAYDGDFWGSYFEREGVERLAVKGRKA